MRKTSLLLFISALAVMAQNPLPPKLTLLMNHNYAGGNQVKITFEVVAKPAAGNPDTLISKSIMGG